MVLHDYGKLFVINAAMYEISSDCLNTLIMVKSVTGNVIPDVVESVIQEVNFCRHITVKC